MFMQTNDGNKLWLENVCRKNSFEISAAKLHAIEKYVACLLEWNKKVNLISRREQDNIWKRQILSSISFLFTIKLNTPAKVLDLGTGGGLPGIPFAIIHPQNEIILLDSIQKKINAVTDILSRLHLQNVSAICGRAEELYGRPEFRMSFDYVVARAVAPIMDIVKWGKPFLKLVNNENPICHSKEKYHVIPKRAIIMLKGGELSHETELVQRRLPSVKIFSYPIIIEGIETGLLTDKKVVIAYP